MIPRPLVVLVPDVMAWVLGTWARQLAKWNRGFCDYLIVPVSQLGSESKLLETWLPRASAVHCLSPWNYERVNSVVDSLGFSHLPRIASVHHIVRLEDVEHCLAADRILVMSRETREILARAGVSSAKLFLVRAGVDPLRFRPRPQRAARQRLGLAEETFTIGFCSKLSSDHDGRKGVDVLQRVLSGLGTIGLPFDLAVTGPGWDSHRDLRKHFKARARHFPFLPPSEMPYFFSALDCLLVTSRVEGGPMPAFEAMSCEVPVVSTRVGMLSELVERNGFFFSAEMPNEAVEAVAAIRAQPEMAARVGRASRELVLREFTWRKVVEDGRPLYTDLPSASSGRLGFSRRRELERVNRRLRRKDLMGWAKRNDLSLKEVLDGPGERAAVALRAVVKSTLRRLPPLT